MHEKQINKRTGLQVMIGLIGMVKPLLGIMIIAILMGCLGNLMAAFITILGGVGIGAVLGVFEQVNISTIFIVIILFAVFRGILRYAEQASNHYIAFKLLARIRHQVFSSLRQLAPAKLDGNKKGNLISIITSDIELLEVFYAHTISPIAIACITSLIMCLFIGYFYWGLGILAGIFYCLVGIVIPVLNSKAGLKYGVKYRNLYGQLNTLVLDNLYGLDEILQFQQQNQRMEKMNQYTEELEQINCTMKLQEAWQKIITDSTILLAGIGMTVCCGYFVVKGNITLGEAIICITAMMSSFGPTAALSALSNNLNQTIASGNRVLNLLDEKPIITDVNSNTLALQGDILANNVSFHYNDNINSEGVLNHFTAQFKENKIHGILGKSGCGKSTLLKLFMRFYETDSGTILFKDKNVNNIDTVSLRNHISYVTQETFLFQDTIENNIKIANANATREEVIDAAKKASIHDFISSLPKGYDTKLSELGESVSGGERQRIGVARAFLHNAKVILLDEPTSNIDSLNEGIILKSLWKEKQDKTIILVSHRKSTMGIADELIRM